MVTEVKIYDTQDDISVKKTRHNNVIATCCKSELQSEVAIFNISFLG